MPELTTYLKKLKFDPKLNDSLFGKYVRNIRLVVLLVLLIFISGLASFLSLPRVLNPEINIAIVNVSTLLPGASPEDIESLVTIPIEDSLNDIPDVKTVTSTSQDSVSIVTLEFESGVNPDKAKADVQSAVDSVANLPENAENPNVQKLDFENQPVWTFTLNSKNADALSLVRFGRLLRDKLEDIPSVDRVEVSGLDDEEIQILVQPEKIALYGINPAAISQTVKTATGSQPAGVIATDNSSFVLTVDPTVTSIEELRRIRIKAGPNTVRLSDIATIQERTKPDSAISYIATADRPPVETIRFDVFKTGSANITKPVEEAKKAADELTEQYGNTYIVSSILNTGEEIDKQYYELIRDFLITVTLVFIALLLFLGIRQAVIASFAIPLTFLITFLVMNLTSLPLSFIAFFSLLLSLGLLVDDTIVVISAVTAYYRTGKFTPLQAGLLVWRDFKTPILTTTLTTVWAFIPLLLSTGIIGEFIRAIPIVVSSTLLASLGVALLITLPLLVLLLSSGIPYRVVVLFRILGVLFVFGVFLLLMPQGPLFIPALLIFALNLFIYFQIRYILFARAKKRIAERSSQKSSSNFSRYVNNGVINFEVVERKYRNIIDRILSTSINRRKTVLAVVIFSIFSYLLVPLGFVRNEFFPKSDVNNIYLSLELPAGTNLSQTKKEMINITEDLRKTKDVSFVTATPRLGIDPARGFGGANDNNALITVILPEAHDRSTSSIDMAESFRTKYASYSAGKISVIEESGGPPAGSDLQIKLSGEDLAVLDRYADQIQNYLQKQPGVTNISKSIKAGTSKIVFVPDEQKLLDAGITQEQLGLFMRTYASGFTLKEDAKLQEESDDNRNIVLRTATTQQTTLATGTIAIPTQTGSVPLGSLGSFELRPNPSLITREDGKRTISVSAGVRKGILPTEENAKLEKFADTLNLPTGYAWQTGGINEENQSSVNAILQAMVLSFFLIIVTMVLQFSSFRKALIVMLVIPLSISGVFIVFSVTNTPLSFPALIGVLALFGIVVKNSILIVDKINQNLKEKMPFRQAIVEASESRLEPITLTSIATILGLIPITLSDPFWRGLGGAIISGLIFSGTMMLFFIPVVYYLVFQKSEGQPEVKKRGLVKK